MGCHWLWSRRVVEVLVYCCGWCRWGLLFDMGRLSSSRWNGFGCCTSGLVTLIWMVAGNLMDLKFALTMKLFWNGVRRRLRMIIYGLLRFSMRFVWKLSKWWLARPSLWLVDMVFWWSLRLIMVLCLISFVVVMRFNLKCLLVVRALFWLLVGLVNLLFRVRMNVLIRLPRSLLTFIDWLVLSFDRLNHLLSLIFIIIFIVFIKFLIILIKFLSRFIMLNLK